MRIRNRSAQYVNIIAFIFNNIHLIIRIFPYLSKMAKKFPRIDPIGRRYTTVPCHAPGETRNGETGSQWRGLYPPPGRHWRIPPRKLEEMDQAGLIEWSANGVPRIKNFAD